MYSTVSNFNKDNVVVLTFRIELGCAPSLSVMAGLDPTNTRPSQRQALQLSNAPDTWIAGSRPLKAGHDALSPQEAPLPVHQQLML
jgi:hypothetical protein